MLAEILAFVLDYWPLALVVAATAHLARNKFHNGLHKYPGPAIAAYTDLWRFFENFSRKTEVRHQKLHEQYGDIVRLGPNELSFANPQAVKAIYGLNKGMTKSEFYPVQMAMAKGHLLPSLFSTMDEGYHARYKRCVNHAFAMSSLVHYEPLVDSTTDCFIEQTKARFCGTDTACDFTRWLHFYAFDVIGELTWSKRLGFLERNEDVSSIIKSLGWFFSYAGPIGQMPWLDKLWAKNPVKVQLERLGLIKKESPFIQFALEQMAQQSAVTGKIKAGIFEPEEGKPMNMMMKFIQAQTDHPEFMTDTQVMASCNSMVVAGSETTAISLSAVFYYLLKNPETYRKLMRELDDAQLHGNIEQRANLKVSWAESQRLPYLEAVVQESFRLHPAAGLILERVVPPQGAEILGRHIPGGTIVGCNPWVLHKRREIFGADVHAFRPERWLEAQPDRLREMNATMMQFGSGPRTCIGKNISLLEMYKLVPTFLRNFELDFATPGLEWQTWNAWFVSTQGFMTTFKPRNIPASA